MESCGSGSPSRAGCTATTSMSMGLARIAGHSSIAISARYVHPSDDAVLDAMSRVGGHKIGHNANATVQLPLQTM
jgi:hypothetical protein